MAGRYAEVPVLRLMGDSTTLTDIWVDLPMAATYENGAYACPMAAVQHRFPGRGLVRINVTGDPGAGDCADVENGDMKPADLPVWYDRRRAAGVQDLAVYASDNQTLWDEIEHALGRGRTHYRWVATLNGKTATTISYHVDAVQFAGQDLTGAHIDLSVVNNPRWHPSPALAAAEAHAGVLGTFARQIGTAAATAEQQANWLEQRLAQLA